MRPTNAEHGYVTKVINYCDHNFKEQKKEQENEHHDDDRDCYQLGSVGCCGTRSDYVAYWVDRLSDKNHLWWVELGLNVNPEGYVFYRKTKAGKWEVLLKITDTTDKALVAALFEAMYCSERVRYGKHGAMKVTSLNGRQIFSSYYMSLYENLTYKFDSDMMIGLCINKGEEYLIFHPTLKEESIKIISNYFCKLAGKHNGIKSFRPAKIDKRDGNLFWGWLTFYDGYKISIAYDNDFRLYNQYKNNLQPINIFYLLKK